MPGGAATAQVLAILDSEVTYWKRGERLPATAQSIRVARAYGHAPSQDPSKRATSPAVTVGEGGSGRSAEGLAKLTDVEIATELL